jgi:hypothetical protein
MFSNSIEVQTLAGFLAFLALPISLPRARPASLTITVTQAATKTS